MVATKYIDEVNDIVRDKLGVDWDLIETEERSSFRHIKLGIYNFTDPIFGKRICDDGFKIGTSSWVVWRGTHLKSYRLAGKHYGVECLLGVFQIPNIVEIRKHIPQCAEYWCQMYSLTNYFPIYDMNAIPLKSAADAENYLTGWEC